MLGYRTIFPVVENRTNVETVALGQLRSWLKGKGYDADALQWNARAELEGHVTGLLQELNGDDHSRSVRARIVENTPSGRWSSTLTIHQPGDSRRDPWVWLDIDAPEGRQAAIPRLARDLLGVFSSVSGAIDQPRAEPAIIYGDEADELVEMILDESRHRMVFVAGSDEHMPLQRWQELLKRVLSDTVGLASSFVLDSEATTLVRRRLGDQHAVHPGTVRTFIDRVDPEDGLDAMRHRILSTHRLVNDDPRAIARTLGRHARTAALSQPLSRAASRVDQLLERQLNDLVLAPAAQSATTVPPRSPDPEVIGVKSDSDVEPSKARPSTHAPSEHASASREIGLRVLGVEHLSEEHVEHVIQLALEGQAARSQQSALAERLEELQQHIDSDRTTIDELKRRVEDEQLEAAQLADDAREQASIIQHLRNIIAREGLGELAWTEPEAEADEPPTSFDELLERARELPRVQLTLADKDTALELDIHEPLGRWAKQTWGFLRALQDYAEHKSNGTVAGDVEHYLNNTPTGSAGAPPKRHARDESATVRSTQRYSRHRELPVPQQIEPTGRVFMGAHFKIAQFGMVSPRMHYFDATAIDGKIYVGYIGPHLPNTLTN